MFNKNEYLFSSRSKIKTVLNVWYICTISLYGTFFSENKISTFDMYFAGTCWFTEKKIIMSLDGALQEYHEQLLPRDS